jgi:hypothetical protein
MRRFGFTGDDIDQRASRDVRSGGKDLMNGADVDAVSAQLGEQEVDRSREFGDRVFAGGDSSLKVAGRGFFSVAPKEPVTRYAQGAGDTAQLADRGPYPAFPLLNRLQAYSEELRELTLRHAQALAACLRDAMADLAWVYPFGPSRQLDLRAMLLNVS